MSYSFLFVVPTLNSYHLLPRLVSSLQAQTWKNWRLLFVDGPSESAHRKWLNQCVSTEALFFWGSDDYAAYPNMLQDIVSALNKTYLMGHLPDLVICKGRYVAQSSGELTRPTFFNSSGLLNKYSFRSALLFGSSPPHQATLFAPGARNLLCRYNSRFRLAADLDYFLRLSTQNTLIVQCLDLEIVHMLDGGISGRLTCLRLLEVISSYMNSFGFAFFVPFISRYIRRILSILPY